MTDKEIMIVLGSIVIMLLVVFVLFSVQIGTEANTYYYHFGGII